MNIVRLALPIAIIFAFSASVFADDDDLAPRGGKGTVTIITDPPNSDVFLDGVDLGKSPITKKSFHTGPLRLIIMDQGKELINTRFNVWPNKENVYKGATTMPIGGIKVTTNPDKCRVLLDGETADKTDGSHLMLNSIEAGDHTVGADCGGKLRYFEELVKVKGEQIVEVHLDVKNRKATVKTGKKTKEED